MANRRKFLTSSAAGLALLAAPSGVGVAAPALGKVRGKALVISTWDEGVAANQGAWKILSRGGRALDAAEAGVMVTEASQNCCVGLGGNPDREGIVTLDACIMDDQFNCGSVAALERIKHPISVARRVMEKTPHVMLVGAGAQQFAVAQGFPLEPQQLSPNAEKEYREWLKTSSYKPILNIEIPATEKPAPSAAPKITIPLPCWPSTHWATLAAAAPPAAWASKCAAGWATRPSSGRAFLWIMK